MKASKVFIDSDAWKDLEVSFLVCPICQFEYSHLGRPYIIKGNDNYEAFPRVRGNLTVIPVSNECGCQWELCFGEHKGSVACFTRIIEKCK